MKSVLYLILGLVLGMSLATAFAYEPYPFYTPYTPAPYTPSLFGPPNLNQFLRDQRNDYLQRSTEPWSPLPPMYHSPYTLAPLYNNRGC